jgi:NAD(P)-dependent dehydrogenase (short-subunit alcohol dehydrogenase family)
MSGGMGFNGPRQVLVTGGASGLGAAVVELLSRRGDDVVVLDMRQPASEVDAQWIEVDLADGRAAEAAVDSARKLLDRPLNVVVAAAGVDACGPFADVPGPLWERVIAVNLIGTAAVVRAAWPDLTNDSGRVVLVASTLGLRALPDATAYCASKFGIVGFARALAAESGGHPAVTCLIPGGMATPFFDGRPEQYRPGRDAALNDPMNVARAVEFAIDQPPGCEVRELLVCPSKESSWP